MQGSMARSETFLATLKSPSACGAVGRIHIPGRAMRDAWAELIKRRGLRGNDSDISTVCSSLPTFMIPKALKSYPDVPNPWNSTNFAGTPTRPEEPVRRAVGSI